MPFSRTEPAEVGLSVHAADGKPVGKVTTEKLLGVLDLLETAWHEHGGRSLARSLPALAILISGLGACEARVAALEKDVLCDRCPDRHEDAAAGLAKAVEMLKSYRAALECWRSR